MKRRINTMSDTTVTLDGAGWTEALLDFGWVRVRHDGKLVRQVVLEEPVQGRSDPWMTKLLHRVWHYGLNGLDLKFDLSGLSRFARRILAVCARIRFGEVITYGALAQAAGYPGAARAVGQVMAHNRFAIFFPCHRVVGADGRLGGFTGGTGLKRRLLELEGWQIEGRGFNARLLKSRNKVCRGR
ncbi:MAG: MGMT family protein [candidate division WOR-3 bacterium]